MRIRQESQIKASISAQPRSIPVVSTGRPLSDWFESLSDGPLVTAATVMGAAVCALPAGAGASAGLAGIGGAALVGGAIGAYDALADGLEGKDILAGAASLAGTAAVLGGIGTAGGPQAALICGAIGGTLGLLSSWAYVSGKL